MCGLPVRGRPGNDSFCVTWQRQTVSGFPTFPIGREGSVEGLHSGIQAYRRGALHRIEVLCCILCRGWMTMVCRKDGKSKASGGREVVRGWIYYVF